MGKPEFVYITYIATSPEKLWNALLDPKLTAQYWQHENVSDWKAGSKWEHRAFDEARSLRLVGRVIESQPPRRLVLTWAYPGDTAPEEKHSRVTFDLEPAGDTVRLTVTHENFQLESDMFDRIRNG
ncbi:MAG TPA: SRPBCC family protein, partial [Thermoanaerobaculia bacterium]|nr:SRPBCC family protein [Thermoanaerobaculia bacterium]